MLHHSCNLMVGHVTAIIEKNSPVVIGADVTINACDPTTNSNQMFVNQMTDLINNVITKLHHVWITKPLATTIRQEEFLHSERKRLKGKYGKEAYNNRDTTNPSSGFNNGDWSEEELTRLEEGLEKYRWGDWMLITGHFVKSQYADECRSKAKNKRFSDIYKK